MNDFVKIIFVCLLVFLTPFNKALSQEKGGEKMTLTKEMVKADGNYKNLNFVDAIHIYENVAKKGYASSEIYCRLGNLYYFRAKYGQAKKWYDKLFAAFPENIEAITYLRYSQCLRSSKENEKAQTYYNHFQELSDQFDSNNQSRKAIDYTALIKENSDRYSKVKPLKKLYDPIQITYGHTIKNNELVFSSTQKQAKTFLNTKDAWDGKSFFSLFSIPIDSTNHTSGKAKKIKGKLHKRFHESSPVYTSDGKTIYFTRSRYSVGEKNKTGIYLEIVRSHFKNGHWQKPVDLSINSKHSSTAHPALNADETKIYFSSDRSGGYGQNDLYVADIHADESLGVPINLGAEINTPGRESFPFVTRDSVLYFSSDGHYGLGGLDVFAYDLKKKDSHVVNIGKPINSYADDFSYGLNTRSKYGFFSSNRSKNKDTLISANIYTFKEINPVKDVYEVKIEGYITDKDTGGSIAQTTVTLIDLKTNKQYARLKTDENGYYNIKVKRFSQYIVRAEKKGYETDEKVSKVNRKEQRIDLQLQNMTILPGSDLAKMLNIPKIYFDFDKYNIRKPDAARDLEKVYQVLKKYPKLRLEIRSHTDSRGSDAYNLKLSQRRAKSTKIWLVRKGIDAARLKTDGVGEKEPVNRCTNGVPCSEDKHQENRRSEFIAL